eukprot:Lithocolla_globosa_v1_NODE_237_length_4940_cov_56.687001.p5 type:complete len:102 gc:universal NODE_237_length_4940_cov_56.687001:3621-3316(-)
MTTCTFLVNSGGLNDTSSDFWSSLGCGKIVGGCLECVSLVAFLLVVCSWRKCRVRLQTGSCSSSGSCTSIELESSGIVTSQVDYISSILVLNPIKTKIKTI